MPPEHPTKIGIAGERYAGWLDVMRTAATRLDSYRTESIVDFGCGWTELRRLSWSQPLESTWHTQERCYFLSLLLDGPARASMHNVAHADPRPYGGRRVLLVPPDQTITSVSPARGQLRSMRCVLDADFVESICAIRPNPDERTLLGATDYSGSMIEWLLLRMYREVNAARLGMRIAVESIAREIAVEIARMFERMQAEDGRRIGGLPSWRMRLILTRIHADGPMPKVSDLAEISGMTPRHLGRAFRAETGKSIGRFIAAAMADRAGRMLDRGMPVGAVAAALGYASSSSFAHAFRLETGLLPSTYCEGRRRLS